MENLKDKTHTSCASGKMIKGSTVDEERKRAQLARLRGNLGGGGSCMHSRMSFPFKPEGGSVIGLIHGKDGTLGMPVPFERDIFLFDTCVAGTSHVEGIEALESQLREGERLAFFREPDNPHDPQAILVQTMSGQTVGYVPRRDNVVFARLMDAGKQLFGTISKKEKKGNWLSLSIQIFLHE